MDYLVDDPKTAVIALFVETIRDPEGVADACRRARDAGKPVIALKVGRSELACRVATTHTGAIAGSDRTLDAFFRRWHVIRVNTLDELLETSILFSGLRGAPTTSRRVGMSTVSGGEMGMLADICSDYGLEFPPLSKEGKAGLRSVLPPYAPLANPLDAWGSGDLKEAYPASLSILAREPAVDLLIVSAGHALQYGGRTDRPVLRRGRSSSAGTGGLGQACGRRIQHFRRDRTIHP